MSDYVLINGELYHHGVKGMKWGVRKKVRNAITKSRAEKVLKTHRHTYAIAENVHRNRSVAERRKSFQYKQKGLENKAKDYAKRSEASVKAAEDFMKRRFETNRYLSDIKTGVLEAGKDYSAKRVLSGWGTHKITIYDASNNEQYSAKYRKLSGWID